MSNVAALIRKDFLLSRSYILFLIPYLAFLTVTNSSSAAFNISLFISMPSVLMLITACTHDIRNVNLRFSLSLPVRREVIVAAKYISILPYVLGSALFTVGVFLLLDLFGVSVIPLSGREFGFAVLAVPFICAIYLPVYYWLGPKGSQYVNIVFFMIVFFGSMNIGSLIDAVPGLRSFLQNRGEFGAWAWLAGGVLYAAWLAVSYLISRRLFTARDL